MGARKHHAPRRGSLGVRPRKRASRIIPRVKSWPSSVETEKPVLLAFLGYKAGMSHAFIVDQRKGSPTHGMEIFTPVTVVETPPMIPLAIRTYSFDPNIGRKVIGEAWIQPPPDLELHRKISTLGSFDFDKKIKEIEEKISKTIEIRVLAASQPKLAGGLEKKKPDLLEIKIGGGDSIEGQLDYAKQIIGKQVRIFDIFNPGCFVDVIGVTKGKGFQGMIKRFGVKELPRWHKHRKGSRKSGSRSHGRGTWSETPQAGQLGFHRRTDFNKRILMMGEDGLAVTPSGGFLNYGIVKTDFVVLQGTIPGPAKRPLVLRYPVRPPAWIKSLDDVKPVVTYLSLSSKQGN